MDWRSDMLQKTQKRIREAHPSTKWGYIFLTMGVVPGALWVLDYVDVIRPGSRPEEWPIILMCMFFVGLGLMLINGEGKSISEAFLSWFSRRDGS